VRAWFANVWYVCIYVRPDVSLSRVVARGSWVYVMKRLIFLDHYGVGIRPNNNQRWQFIEFCHHLNIAKFLVFEVELQHYGNIWSVYAFCAMR
jgi:hypothetical protein